MTPIFPRGRVRRNFTRRDGLKLAFSALWARCVHAGEPTALAASALAASAAEMIRKIPPRGPQALTGSQFADSISNLDRREREHAILTQLLEGNLPGFLRRLSPIRLSYKPAGEATLAATIFVMPEYLAIGSDSDFLRIPMNLHTAALIADSFDFVLPTKKIVDAIYDHSRCKFTPQPLPAGPQMTSTGYYRTHNAMIATQSQTRGFPSGALVSGHKKDLVLTNRLSRRPGQLAIYGWHRAPGAPIQPLSTVHGAGYADYSHGIRLVSQMVMIKDRLRSIHDMLRDSLFANVLSDEGPIRNLALG